MIIIRNTDKDDITTIVNFNSVMAMKTENKELNPVTVQKGVETILNNRDYGFYLIAESDGVPIAQLMVTKEWFDV